MKAGDLKNRITLRKPVRSRNSFNESETTYEDVATVWAAVDWKSGRRYESAAQLNAEVEGVIRIRYRSDIRPEWQIVYGSRVIEILSLANVNERDKEIVIWCRELGD